MSFLGLPISFVHTSRLVCNLEKWIVYKELFSLKDYHYHQLDRVIIINMMLIDQIATNMRVLVVAFSAGNCHTRDLRGSNKELRCRFGDEKEKKEKSKYWNVIG